MAKKCAKKKLSKRQRDRQIRQARYEWYENELLRGRDFAYAIVGLGLATIVTDAIAAEQALIERKEHLFQSEEGNVPGQDLLPDYEEDLSALEAGVAWARHEGLSYLATWVREEGEASLFEFPDRLVEAFRTGTEERLAKLKSAKRRIMTEPID